MEFLMDIFHGFGQFIAGIFSLSKGASKKKRFLVLLISIGIAVVIYIKLTAGPSE